MTVIAGVCASAAGAAAEKRAHEETSFEVTVHAPYAETAKLFGPEGERVWAGKHWNPQFVYPQPGKDERGAVFTNQHGPLQAIWVIARHDLQARQFQYVYVIPGIMVCTIDVGFAEVGAGMTKVRVTYARTSLSAQGDGAVAEMADGDRRARVEWQVAIDGYLAKRP